MKAPEILSFNVLKWFHQFSRFPHQFFSLLLSQHQSTHKRISESGFYIQSTINPHPTRDFLCVHNPEHEREFSTFSALSFLRKINKHKLWLHSSTKSVLRGNFEWQRAVKRCREKFIPCKKFKEIKNEKNILNLRKR